MSVDISLVIPTCNRAHLIVQTVDAALNQTRNFSEIIVVDDGSTDHTPEVLAPYAGRIKLIRTDNRGVQAARNTGVQAASGEYVTFCDSDDLLDPDYVETVGDWLAGGPAVELVYTNLVKFTDSVIDADDFSGAPSQFMLGAKTRGAFFYDIPELYLRLFTVHPFCITGCTVKKSFFESIGGFDTSFNRIGAEDSEFTLRAVASGRAAYCRTPLAWIRRHAGNQSDYSVHVDLGRAQILEHAAVHHPNVGAYAQDLRDHARSLRLHIADSAYAKGDFETVREIYRHDAGRRMGLKPQLKKIISYLPDPVRTQVWKVTQMGGIRVQLPQFNDPLSELEQRDNLPV
jgi:glycosyltransferase involved in cell wall biosynthesis